MGTGEVQGCRGRDPGKAAGGTRPRGSTGGGPERRAQFCQSLGR